nr:iron-containing redox enzyme family protein [Gluconacetobacter asukensis]
MTASGRAAMVAAGLKRLGVGLDDRHYFDLHAVLDIRHSAMWNAEIIGPLVAEDPRRAVTIAEGALMRLECGAACFRRYREHFGWG